jgi:hypothetical protein
MPILVMCAILNLSVFDPQSFTGFSGFSDIVELSDHSGLAKQSPTRNRRFFSLQLQLFDSH